MGLFFQKVEHRNRKEMRRKVSHKSGSVQHTGKVAWEERKAKTRQGIKKAWDQPLNKYVCMYMCVCIHEWCVCV